MQLEGKVTWRKGVATQIADEVIAKGKRFYFFKWTSGTDECLVPQDFSRTLRIGSVSDIRDVPDAWIDPDGQGVGDPIYVYYDVAKGTECIM